MVPVIEVDDVDPVEPVDPAEAAEIFAPVGLPAVGVCVGTLAQALSYETKLLLVCVGMAEAATA